MNVSEVLTKLDTFNEAVDKLERRNFIESSRQSGINFSLQINTGLIGKREIRGNIGFEGPSEEETDAFILTCRLLVRDTDGISLRKIEEYYENYIPKIIYQ